VVLGTTSTTAFTDSAVAPSKTYVYSVVAIDGGGNRSPAVSASVTTPGETAAPSRPTGLIAKAVSGPWRVKLSWLPSTDDVGVTGYRVYREGVVIATVGVPKYVDQAVVAGKKYHYAVSALDAAGNESPLSATVSAPTK
jgi:cellulose 1,4-beta-cellobiosidase